jgi:hypothetical protein
MRIIPLLALLIFAAPAPAQDEKTDERFPRLDQPTKEQAAEAVDALKAAFKEKKRADLQMEALRKYGAYADSDVVRQVAHGARSKDAGVKLDAIEALGWNTHKEALKQLHRLYRRERELYKNSELFAATLKAIGRHGQKKSLDVLGDRVFKGATPAVTKARIYGIGNIRDKKSVDMLMKGMRLTGTAPDARGARASEPRGMQYFHLSLCVLTGEDFGAVSEDWQRWWRKNKSKFKISQARPDIKPEFKSDWSKFWGEPY